MPGSWGGGWGSVLWFMGGGVVLSCVSWGLCGSVLWVMGCVWFRLVLRVVLSCGLWGVFLAFPPPLEAILKSLTFPYNIYLQCLLTVRHQKLRRNE